MKKRWYRKSGIKGLLVLLTIFFVTVSCVGAGASAVIMNKGVQPLDSKSYVDSQSFRDNVYNLSHTIVNAISNRYILDQASDDELVDLAELNQGTELTHKNTSGLAYRAGDLYDWAKKSSWDRSVNVLICRQPDGNDYYMYYNDFADKIITGELKLVFGSEEGQEEYTKDILSMLSGKEYIYYGYTDNSIGIRNDGVEYVADAEGNVVYTDIYNYESSGNNDAPLKEEYKPDGADGILDVVNNSKEWKGNISRAYQYLYEALVEYSDASYGEKILKTYTQGATNINYMYVDTKSDKVYSNINGVTSANYEKMLDKLTSGADPFMLISPEMQDCILGFTNVSDWTVSYWQSMVENTGFAGENYLYFVSVDKDFPVLDRIKQEKLAYEKFEPWLVPIMVVSVAAFILALVLIYLILSAQFESFKDPLIIMLTVPLAIAGALVFMYFGDITMNIFSQIGIIMLIGLVAKNGILIVEFANQKQETGEDKMQAIKDAALQRLRPILMTSASTVLGLIPLAFATGEGCNQRIAMGTAVVGGMLVSTLLTMYIVPAIYSYVSTNRSKLKNE